MPRPPMPRLPTPRPALLMILRRATRRTDMAFSLEAIIAEKE
jgi:hypothetical protein